MRRLIHFAAIFILATLQPLTAADLPPDKGSEIPESGKRPVVVESKSAQEIALPKHELPDGFALELAAASPLVTHPIMGCLDDHGRLFVGDAVGVNWNKAQLEANPPNRVLMLEDTNGDGRFDKSTVFADMMTFPQGGCWLNGSLYVCSPPGLWKLTDTNNDGVADQREMLVSGFEYTGNAADVHGPFLHPNGRLYWCHGRKGHKVVGKDGNVVHEGLACGIWSCKPDGSDVAWHALGCGDNPVEVDFTPDGDIVGVQNLYYSNPRGDTIVHWLHGGVYERIDQLKAIEGLPRTLEHMPVMYNFGHVAVSGSCFWHRSPLGSNALHFMVTHFNTQRVVRMELTPDGSTYKAVENEFLKLHNPDIHLTDVLEDPRDGSLLVIDTGGWFRIGCPSSLMAKSDIVGAVYRIKSKSQLAGGPTSSTKPWKTCWQLRSEDEVAAQLQSSDPFAVRAALDWVASNQNAQGPINNALVKLLDKQLDSATEHQLIYALERIPPPFMSIAGNDLNGSRLMTASAFRTDVPDHGTASKMVSSVLPRLDPSKSAPLAATVKWVLKSRPEAFITAAPILAEWLKEKSLSIERVSFLEDLLPAVLAAPLAQDLIGSMLGHHSPQVRTAAVSVLATQTSGVANTAWLAPLDDLLAHSLSPTLLDAIKKLKSSHFDAALQAIATDTKQPLSIRLKALDAAKSVKLTGDTFTMVKAVLTDASSSAAAKIQAASMLANAPLQKPQVLEIAPLFGTVGPIELKTLLPLVRKNKDPEIGLAIASDIAKSPVIASAQESHYRTAFADLPPELFETIIHPAYAKAVEATEAKKRQLSALAEQAASKGAPGRGKASFAAGKGTCIACHKIGDVGRSIGPDLSHIGAIRTERDLLESILFPSNTLARDYEAHIIETSDGQQVMGVIRSHTAEGLLIVDLTGQEKTIAHQQITGDTTLTTSLMPMGLDQTLAPEELLDLVAWLRSLK